MSKVLIRYPKPSDIQAMCDYINSLSQEQTFIRFQGEKISLEEETAYLNSQLEKIKKKRAVLLLAFVGDELVGVSGIDLRDKIESHEGIFGISIAKDHRGQGIGKMLMQETLTAATKELTDLKIITLGVFANNNLALKMYQQFGFKEYGRLPGGVKYKNSYVDHVFMYREV